MYIKEQRYYNSNKTKKKLQSNIIIRSYHTLYGYISKILIRRRHLMKYINIKNINFFQPKTIQQKIKREHKKPKSYTHPRLLSWSLVEIFCFVLWVKTSAEFSIWNSFNQKKERKKVHNKWERKRKLKRHYLWYKHILLNVPSFMIYTLAEKYYIFILKKPPFG